MDSGGGFGRHISPARRSGGGGGLPPMRGQLQPLAPLGSSAASSNNAFAHSSLTRGPPLPASAAAVSSHAEMAQPMRLHLGPPPSQQQQGQQFQQQGQQQLQQPQYAQQQQQYAQQPLQQQLQYSDALPPRGQLSQFPPQQQQQQQQQHFQPQQSPQHQFQHSYPPAPASYDPNPAPVPPAQPGMSFVSSQSRMSGGGSGPAGQPQQQFAQQQQQQQPQQFSHQPQPLHHLTPLQAHRPPMVSVDGSGGGGGGMGDSARFTTTEAAGGFYDANTERPSYPPSLASTQEIDSIRSPSDFASQQQQHQQQSMQGTGPMGLPPRHSGAGNITPHIGGGPQIPDRPPVVMRLASTRAPFSPHALKGDGPSPARETMSPTTPATSAPALPPLMASLEELLAPASLQPYLPFVQGRLQAMMASGFQPAPSPVSIALGEDMPPPNPSGGGAPPPQQQPPSPLLVLLMDLDEMQTEGLFDEVEAEAEAHAVYLRPAHRDQITKRVREERAKRATVAEALMRSRRNRTAAAAVKLHSERNNNNVSVGILGAGGVAAGSPVAGSSGVGMDGMRGLLRHWCCCLGLCVMSLLVAVAFLLLYTQLGEPALNSGSSSASSSGGGAPSGGSVNGAGVSSTAQGGWKFLYILSIVGFILAGFAALAAVLSWLRNPLTRSCNPSAFCSSCREVQCKKDCCGECPSCSSLLGECAGACGCAACMEEGRACLSGCCAGIKDQCSFAMPDCPDCQCPSCATLAADCGCADCCPADNGPGFCDGCCEGCCADCGECSAPSCECDCCPDCEGDIRGCCAVLYKVCCCQCKIQVS